jgi:hypothetical protein
MPIHSFQHLAGVLAVLRGHEAAAASPLPTVPVHGGREGGETLKLKPKATERGFLRADFKDTYGKDCSIQESSLATADCIWLGCNTGLHHHATGDCLARMHLDRKQAAALIPLLEQFVATGKLA